jgi:hypothetical protein
MLLATVVAEMKGIKSLIAVAFWQKDLTVEDDFADAAGLNGGVRTSRPGNKLV